MKVSSKIGLIVILILALSVPAIAQVKLPDLIVKEIKCGPGNKLQFTVANIGAALPLKWVGKSHVWINEKSLFDSIDLKNASTTTGGGIAHAWGTSTYITSYIITTGISVKVETDYGNYIKESNEGNNTLAVQLKPCEVIKKPDLIIDSIVGPSVGQPGGGLSETKVTVKNIGTAVAAGGFRIDIVLSTDTVAPVKTGTVSPTFVEDTLLGAGGSVITITSDLAPGASRTAVISLGAGAIPKDTKPGTYYLCATADVKNTISESNESNNTKCSRIMIK